MWSPERPAQRWLSPIRKPERAAHALQPLVWGLGTGSDTGAVADVEAGRVTGKRNEWLRAPGHRPVSGNGLTWGRLVDRLAAAPTVRRREPYGLERDPYSQKLFVRRFGLAQGKVKKQTVRPALYAAPARLLIRALRLAGVRELDLVQAPIFRLIGLDGLEGIDALSDLHRREDLRFKLQADIVEIGLEARR
jgi:hypothetical protein